MSYAPILSAAEIERIRVFAQPKMVTAGQILYQPGDETPPVFVVLSGSIRILALAGGEEQLVTSYSVGQFSGELLMISGRKSIYLSLIHISLRRVLSEVSKVAPTDSTVLLLGETGTGKELIASAINRRSKRCTRAFVRVNCAAIPPSLVASELFGHEKGCLLYTSRCV